MCKGEFFGGPVVGSLVEELRSCKMSGTAKKRGRDLNRHFSRKDIQMASKHIKYVQHY